jgi:hypothetical protein
MTFDDLIFGPHPLTQRDPQMWPDRVQAKQTFHNNYTISVVGGGGLYGDGVETFEVAIFTPDGDFYTPPGGDVFDQVKGWCTKDEVTKIIKNIQNKK